MTLKDLATLRERIGQKLRAAEQRGLTAETVRLRQLAGDIEKLGRALEMTEAEFQRITVAASIPLPLLGQAGDPQGITIRVCWPGRSDPESLSGHNAAQTLRRFLERTVEILGPQSMERVALVETGRGPLVSRSPQADFKNQRSGTVYTHHRIGALEWHVITHSSTNEKLEHLQKACRALGLRDATVTYNPGGDVAAPSSDAAPPPDDGLI